jgi:hypothetical protein
VTCDFISVVLCSLDRGSLDGLRYGLISGAANCVTIVIITMLPTLRWHRRGDRCMTPSFRSAGGSEGRRSESLWRCASFRCSADSPTARRVVAAGRRSRGGHEGMAHDLRDAGACQGIGIDLLGTLLWRVRLAGQERTSVVTHYPPDEPIAPRTPRQQPSTARSSASSTNSSTFEPLTHATINCQNFLAQLASVLTLLN